MRKPIVLLLGGLGLAALGNVACSKAKPAETARVTTIRSGEPAPSTVNVEEVRTVLLTKKPAQADTINALIITNDNGVIGLRGKVEDEATHVDLINHVRLIPGVRAVRDELTVHPAAGVRTVPSPTVEEHEHVGRTTTTGAEDMHPTRADAVRHAMKTAHPLSEDVIKGLVITESGELITISGVVPDEDTHRKLVKAAKDAPGVKDVKDEIKVRKVTTPPAHKTKGATDRTKGAVEETGRK